jgi:outer membrane protein OmpA-like peptidoglycan-associated protein
MRTTTRRTVSAALLVSFGAGLTGCAQMSNKERGAVIGAGTGAAVGGVIGRNSGSTAKGAIIGAVIGGAAGAIIGHQMDQAAKEIDQSIPGASVERVGEGLLVTFESGLLFPYNSDVLTDAARTNLTTLANNMGKFPETDLLIVGHTDATGSDSYNQQLSERRATAARNFLVSAGVAATRIRTMGLGETEPKASNDTPEGQSQNRRVEIAIFANEAAKERARRQAP